MKTALFFLLFISFSKLSWSQDTPVDSLLSDLENTETAGNDLLPERMLFTQRWFWGEKGIYRSVGIAPKILTVESREKELRVRRNMFRIHQGLGLATAAAMLAQGIVGSKLYKSYDDNLKNVHEGLATGINIGYFGTALMAFTSPPPMVNRRKFDNIKLHKILSAVHLSGMITTNVLSKRIDNSTDPAQTKKIHKAVGLTTFGAYALAIASIKFEF